MDSLNIFHFDKNGTPMVEMTKEDFNSLVAEITTSSFEAAKACEHKDEVTTVMAKSQNTYVIRVTVSVEIKDNDSSLAMGRAVALAGTVGNVVAAELWNT